ncbi:MULTISPECIES: NAD(P)-dependent oxidoreductase [unclassified Gordonia (in: high G+C Gram-positive bacteria)]|uniref:NAD(P)-dependent oxidoreductase n=1 Tax=unclassified Gordonia (in: high G+C Gram-positive bacteria) TaxID=2657482 RepID=UPI001F0D2892|nr:SDR family oxidoreductase [Gordonia sp. ABSL49_1]MCH5642366.1 SDR family oxidoreductase [Gordonia sp. ABSL49_1]
MTRIAIIGGHGKIALRAAKILSDRGDEVTSIIRNPAQADDVSATGATPLVADIEQLDTAGIASVLAGQDAVVWSAGAGGGDPSRTYAVDRDAAIRSMDAAPAAGVKRYVMVSYFGAGPDHGVPEDNSFFAYADAKAAADTHLKSTSLDWTILGPSKLTDEPGSGRISVGGERTAGSEVSRANVAQVIAEVVNAPATTHQVIEFDDGSTPITDALPTD